MTSNKTSVRNKLVLDHFYLHFSPEDVAVLRKLEKKLKRIEYKEVTAGKTSWSGLYLYSNIGSYFEMLTAETDKTHCLAFAFRAWNPAFLDTRKIKDELPRLAWKIGKTLWKSTGKTWFDWLYTKTKIPSGKCEIYGWVMHYPGIHAPDFAPPKGQCSLARCTSIEVSMSIQARETLLEVMKWMLGVATIGKSTATLIFTNRDFADFTVKINFHKNSAGAKLASARGESVRGLKDIQMDCGNFRFTNKNGFFTLSNKI